MRKRFKIPLFLFLIITVTTLIITLRPAQVGGGNYYFVISSGSMEPTLNVGDWIVCAKTSFDNVQVDDIITVQHPNEKTLITHRVIDKNENYLTTKGDTCDAPDNFIVYPENVLAKYTGFKIPKLGFLLYFCTRTLPGLIITFYVPGAVVIILQVRKIYKELRKQEQASEEKDH
jgi:signal peptidase